MSNSPGGLATRLARGTPYGYRRDYWDMVMLQVGMDLPVFGGDRQKHGIASALAMGEAAATSASSRQP